VPVRVVAALRLLLALAGVACLGVAGLSPVEDLEPSGRAWLLTGGFGLLSAALLLPPIRAFAPVFVALVFLVYGGFSAVVAVPEPAGEQAERAEILTEEQVEASIPDASYDTAVRARGFRNAAFVTGLAGLLAIGAALASGRRGPSPRGRRVAGLGRVEYAGKALVAVGFVGVALALLRFGLTQIPTDDLWQSFKSMWQGGSYFLLLGTFAVPGFGLWLAGLLARRAPRAAYLGWAGVAATYLALLIPTGQRGFAVALALMVMAILVFGGRITWRVFATVAVLGTVLIGLTQAARNQIRETSGLSPSNYVSRLAPDQWEELYSSQLASFNWTVLVDQNRERLDIPNPFPRALLKPIPRQIYPEKSQGFGTEFTERVYPGAAAQSVSFAIPLTAETDYAFGTAGVVVAFLLLGALAGLAERWVAGRAPPAVEPIVLATIAWSVFCFVRGDFANALVVTAGWIIPLGLVARSIGLRPPAPVRRVLVDALQVAPEFSGIGRRIEEMGAGLAADPPGPPVALRCPRDAAARLRRAFPGGTELEAPLKSSRPRLRRIAYQQIVAPLRDAASTLLVCPGDQAPLWGRAPLVFVIHDVRRLTDPQTSGGRLEALYYRLVLRAGARRAARVLTISEFSRQEILRTLDPSCPVEVVASHPPPRGRAAQPDGADTFVVVGALRRYKGLETVVDALARNGRQAKVVCVGGEEGSSGEADRLRARARELGVEARFRIAGWVPDEELAELLSGCAGTISASAYEGYGMPVAESLAAGLPTIASDIPAHREVAGEAALYFPPGDADALAAALARVAGDAGLRAELAARAAERAARLAGQTGSWGEAIAASLPAAWKSSRA
jgi:glycosyltransferase involved in cell wall biosynthesis